MTERPASKKGIVSHRLLLCGSADASQKEEMARQQKMISRYFKHRKKLLGPLTEAEAVPARGKIPEPSNQHAVGSVKPLSIALGAGCLHQE